MSTHEVRPHVELEVSLPPDGVMERLEAVLKAPGVKWEARLLGHHVQVGIPAEERHIWSPWLDCEVVPAESGSRLSGRFGPQPNVWTMYLAVYAALLFTAMGLGFLGVAQQIAKEPAWGYWGIPVTAVLAIVTYLIPFLGQRLTKEQMVQIRELLMQSFADDSPRWIDD